MTTREPNTIAPSRTARNALVLCALAWIAGCADRSRDDGPQPFLLPEGAAQEAAPFRGPALSPADLAAERGAPGAPAGQVMDPLPSPPLPLAPPVAEIAAPSATPARAAADRRREAWLGSWFRCKAISTTRLRRCKFEATADGHTLRFQMSDVVCDDVVFDENGDPSRLTGCRGAWLRVPATARLRPDRAHRVWSGSHSGWRWGSDGQKYCCPGIWLEAPASLSDASIPAD